MKIRFCGEEVKGKINAPPSKSHTHRALFISALAEDPCTIKNPLFSHDTLSSIKAIESFGANVEQKYHKIEVDGRDLHPSESEINAGNSGTTLRFVSAFASLFDSETTIDGDSSLRNRPVQPLLDCLTRMGAKCSSTDGKAPITVCGPIKGGDAFIEGGLSSQFVSSVMMTAPLLEGGLDLTITDLVSRFYVDTTVEMMQHYGATVGPTERGYKVENSGYTSKEYVIPGDASSAAFLLGAGALSGPVSVQGLDERSGADLRMIDILREMGADVTVKKNAVISAKSDLKAIDVDLSDSPDLFPVTAILMSVAEGTSRIYNVSRLRFKESDRIATAMKMINDLGGCAQETEDGCIIKGVKRLKGGEVDNFSDHRIMMAGAVASLVSDSPVVMNECECCSVSYPEFMSDMSRMGMEMEVV